MLPKFHPLSAKEFIKFLKSLGFTEIRQKGSHKIFENTDGRVAVVPFHQGEELGIGLVLSILKDVNSSKDELAEWLESR